MSHLLSNQGAAWFRGIGSSQSPGTKTFAITGEVANTGLIEVPMARPYEKSYLISAVVFAIMANSRLYRLAGLQVAA